MKLRYLLAGIGTISILSLAGGLAGVGVTNLDKPKQIRGLEDEIKGEIYTPVPYESRLLPKTGPALPSPGYEN